ncbi:hypothetical protein DV515_00016019 [Chloebia gouldiae]|uniref:G-protein coupled receptors family 1 profile domain-containing protein n=1 Tax=Chloebia gouldiae TaxID=44316 RepID=A0A3L8RUZ1_CHLGU|nr:hypothetical protein DV515_00016019 [Chloebia gouldiae]
MKPQLCVHLVVAAWVLGFSLPSYRLFFLSELSFCGSKIPHFLCDNSPLFKLSYSDTSLLWKIDSVFLPCVILGSLCLTLAFYICILFCVLHLPAASGRKKALTVCSSHLITLSIAYGRCFLEDQQNCSPAQHSPVPILKSIHLQPSEQICDPGPEQIHSQGKNKAFPLSMVHFWKVIPRIWCHLLHNTSACECSLQTGMPQGTDAPAGLCQVTI